jgi:hypothetical protein
VSTEHVQWQALNHIEMRANGPAVCADGGFTSLRKEFLL